MEDPKLFNVEEYEQQPVENQGPVTCLGMEFANDEERRKYFREELRKKLPELRQIEGFPIGEDDDIIALSDPPYYTACPNPWLNDFVAEWEKEKEQLVAEGKRIPVKNVLEPYANDVSVGKNNPVYTAHTYHTKVPHPAIMRYILHYTEPGDIVLDGFCGTGMTGVAAQACGNHDGETTLKIEQEFASIFGEKPKWGVRHAICSDLSPYAESIAQTYNVHINKAEFQKEAKRVIAEIAKDCEWLYVTHDEKGNEGLINYVVWSDVMCCKECGKEFVYWDAAMSFEKEQVLDDYNCPHCGCSFSKLAQAERVWESVYDTATNSTIRIVKSVPVLIVYTCKGKRLQKKPDEYDLELLKKIRAVQYQGFVATQEVPYGEKTREPKRTHGISHVHLYNTKRNSYALSIALKHIEESKFSNELKFLFTGMVNRSSKMNRIHVSNFFHGGGGWNAGHMKGTLYVPNIPVETSILEQLDDKLNSLLRALPFLSEANTNSVSVCSANALQIADNSVDYIFIDPPFGANIMYSELNFIVEGWLRVLTNNNTEAIENRVQNKSAAFYQDMMSQCFSEYYRVLKPGRWMTVEFSNTSAAVWNSIQRAISMAGFVIANVSALDKKQGGMRSITTSTAVRQDLAISCYKPTEDLLAKAQVGQKFDAWDFLAEHINRLPVHLVVGKSTTAVVERSAKILYDRLVSFFVEKGLSIPLDAAEFQAGLRSRYIERDGMFFTAQQAAEYEDKRKNTTDFVPMGLLIDGEANGIAWLRRELEHPQTYQELQPKWMQALAKQKKGDMQIEMRTLLEENFIEEPDGKWRLPDPEEEADREKLRIKGLMREFAAYAELATKPKSKIKQVRLEALREGFKQCWQQKAFETIVNVGDKIPEEMLQEDEVLLRYYDIASRRVL